jgi:hypothetical protein
MATSLYMVRTPGTKDFPALAHLLEGRVYDGVAKEDAARLVEAGLAEEFDDGNELHVAAVEEFHHLDARRGAPEAARPPKAAEKPAPAKDAAGYEDMTVEELHAEAAKRNLDGRAGLNKADTIKLIEKDDAKKGKK